jgi:hypothetical protein
MGGRSRGGGEVGGRIRNFGSFIEIRSRRGERGWGWGLGLSESARERRGGEGICGGEGRRVDGPEIVGRCGGLVFIGGAG